LRRSRPRRPRSPTIRAPARGARTRAGRPTESSRRFPSHSPRAAATMRARATCARPQASPAAATLFRSVRRLALSALIVALAGGIAVEATATKPQPLQSSATVVGVRSGDALVVRLAKTGKQERVRLLGVASPSAGSCYAQQAADGTRTLVEGQHVMLTADHTAHDRAGNLLAYAALSDGSDLGKQLLAKGLAQINVWDPPASRFLSYVSVQQKAEDATAGMWGACAANVGVTMKGSADPLLIDDRIEYTATITNQGPLTALNVTIDVRPGSEAQYVSADSPDGKCNSQLWDGNCWFGPL